MASQVTDISSYEFRLSSRWATHGSIENTRIGIIHEHRGTLIDQAHRDKNGMTELGFEPPRSDVGEARISSRVIAQARGIGRPIPTRDDDSSCRLLEGRMQNDLHGEDRVLLKAGSPVMTVINPEGAVGEFWCLRSVDARPVKDAFSPNALEKVSG
jgi:hypothetical protein